jgi:hypothetical protein
MLDPDELKSDPDELERGADARAAWRARARHLWRMFDRWQRHSKRWIAVDKVVSFYAQEKVGPGASAETREQALAAAYERLIDAIRAGVFEQDVRSRVLRFASRVSADDLLPDWRPHVRSRSTEEPDQRPSVTRRRPRVLSWLAAAQLDEYLRHTPQRGNVHQEVLGFCWLLREQAKTWLAAHGLTAPPYWFRAWSASEPQQQTSGVLTAMPGRLLTLQDLAGYSDLRARVRVLNSIRPYASGKLSATTAVALARAKYGTSLDARPALLKNTVSGSQWRAAWTEANKLQLPAPR